MPLVESDGSKDAMTETWISFLFLFFFEFGGFKKEVAGWKDARGEGKPAVVWVAAQPKAWLIDNIQKKKRFLRPLFTPDLLTSLVFSLSISESPALDMVWPTHIAKRKERSNG